MGQDREKYLENISSSGNKYTINIKKDILESNGIRCEVKVETNDKTANAWGMPMGMEGLVHTFYLQVDPNDREQAEELLQSAGAAEQIDIVLLDREHKIVLGSSGLPKEAIDSVADPRRFKFIGEQNSENGVYQFFVSSRTAGKLPLDNNNYSWTPLKSVLTGSISLGSSLPEDFRDAYCTVVLNNYSPPSKTFGAFYFGSTPLLADKLAKLVTHGKKRATTGLLNSYEAENEPVPKKDDVWVILDGGGSAACVIRTIDVQVLPFIDVTPEMAAEEGEGDFSLKYWQKVHRKFYKKECTQIGMTFTHDQSVVFERFEVLKVLIT